MNRYKETYLNSIILFIFLLYVISIYIFSTYANTIVISQFIFIFLIALMFINILKKNTIQFGNYFKFMFAFTFYCFLSTIWAIDSSAALQKSITIWLLLFMSIMFYNFFSSLNKTEYIIRALCYAGIVASAYTVLYYGINNYIYKIVIGERVGTEITNVNSLGLYTGVSVVICFYYAIYHRKAKFYFLSILPFIVAMGTGSRKALIFIVLGVVILFILNLKNKRIFKTTLVFAIVMTLFIFIIQLPFFSTIAERFEGLLNIVTLQGEIDSSTMKREMLINIGIEQFKNNPILGVGIGNSFNIVSSKFGVSTYLHNNFVELLVDIGIVGFILYYAMFFYIFIKLLPLIRRRNNLAIITFVILSLRILLDYGSVSYYSKTTYIFLILGFLVINDNTKSIMAVKE